MAGLSFRDLRVWQQSMDLTMRIYQTTRSYPKEETYGLASQMRRAAVSVPSNIAEGNSREHLKEYLNHLSMAQGSLAEIETQTELARRLNYIPQDEFQALHEMICSTGKQLRELRRSLSRRLTD
jgi:four helix bundle protein